MLKVKDINNFTERPVGDGPNSRERQREREPNQTFELLFSFVRFLFPFHFVWFGCFRSGRSTPIPSPSSPPLLVAIINLLNSPKINCAVRRGMAAERETGAPQQTTKQKTIINK